MATIMVTGRLEKLIGGLESPSSQLNLDATGSQSPVEFKSKFMLQCITFNFLA